MRYLMTLMVLVFLSSCLSKKAFIEENIITKETQTEETAFPQNWYGKWKGTLMAQNATGYQYELPMEIHFGPTDSTHRHQFSLIYRNEPRNYELVTIDAEKGHYQTDEKNTIYLDAFYLGGTLISRYEVSGNMITTQIEKRDGKLYFSLISGSLTPIAITGDEAVNDFPPVNSFSIRSAQKAELIKYE